MRVQMKATITGTRNGADWPAVGESVDLPDGEATDLLAAGLAVPLLPPNRRRQPPRNRGRSDPPQSPARRPPCPSSYLTRC